MKSLIMCLILGLGLNSVAFADGDDTTSPAIAAKLALRGNANGLKISEMRVSKKNDFLVVQADLQNTKNDDLVVYYRFKWLDSNGNQVGDGEGFKQLGVLGKQLQTVKSVATQPSITDFKLELNVEKK